MSCQIVHGATSHSIPIAVRVNGVRTNAEATPVVDDIIGEDGSSLGAAPNFGLASPPVVEQDLESDGTTPIRGAYRITFTGRAGDGGTFRGGDQYRVLWSASFSGQTFDGEACAYVQAPVVTLTSCCS